jgi:hypothetical protein
MNKPRKHAAPYLLAIGILLLIFTSGSPSDNLVIFIQILGALLSLVGAAYLEP